MVRHIVMFKLLETAEGRTRRENAEIAASMLRDLQGKIPTLVASEVRLDDTSAEKGNYDLVLVADYNDWQGLDEYIVHPLHKAVCEFMKGVRESRACVDYEY